MNPLLAYYGKLEALLAPSEKLVNLLLVAIIIISIWMIVLNKSRTLKLTWLVYLLHP